MCFFKRRKCRRFRRYDISNSYISEVAQESTDTHGHGVQLISYRKLSTDSEECTTDLKKEGQNNISNDKRSASQLHVSSHSHRIHSYDLLAHNV